MLLEHIRLKEVEHLALLNKFLELDLDFLEHIDLLFDLQAIERDVFLHDGGLLDHLVQRLVDALDLLTGCPNSNHVLVEGGVGDPFHALLNRGLIQLDNGVLCLRLGPFSIASLGCCITLVLMVQHVPIVSKPVLPQTIRILLKANVVVQLFNFDSFGSDCLLGFFFHFFKCLLAVLQQVHLKQVVLLQLL